MFTLSNSIPILVIDEYIWVFKKTDWCNFTHCTPLKVTLLYGTIVLLHFTAQQKRHAMGTRKVIGNQLRNRSGIFLIRKKKVVVLPKATTKQYNESKKVLKASKVQKGAFHLFACVYLLSSTCTVNVLHIRGVVVFLKILGLYRLLPFKNRKIGGA